MESNLDPTKLFTPAQLTALDAWIAEQNADADEDARTDRGDLFYGRTADLTACFQALDGQLDLHLFDDTSGTFVSVLDVDDHPLAGVDIPRPKRARRAF